MADMLGGAPDISQHGRSGPREKFDGLLEIIAETVSPAGQQPSVFEGEELRKVIRILKGPPCVQITGDAKGISAEYPYQTHTSLLELRTEKEHRRMGHGVLMLLSFRGARPTVQDCLGLNGFELQSSAQDAPRAHFLGSWCWRDTGPTYVSFVPNAIHIPGILVNLAIPMVNRAGWADRCGLLRRRVGAVAAASPASPRAGARRENHRREDSMSSGKPKPEAKSRKPVDRFDGEPRWAPVLYERWSSGLQNSDGGTVLFFVDADLVREFPELEGFRLVSLMKDPDRDAVYTDVFR
jgi:hypothetical protein